MDRYPELAIAVAAARYEQAPDEATLGRLLNGLADERRPGVECFERSGNGSLTMNDASSSTLRRRLKEAGTTHQKLLDEVRCELACKTLRTPGMSVGEAAFLVGFSDSSAFHKAFRRWTSRSAADFVSSSSTEQG